MTVEFIIMWTIFWLRIVPNCKNSELMLRFGAMTSSKDMPSSNNRSSKQRYQYLKCSIPSPKFSIFFVSDTNKPSENEQFLSHFYHICGLSKRKYHTLMVQCNLDLVTLLVTSKSVTNCIMSLNWMILSSKLKNGLWKIVTNHRLSLNLI